MIPPITIEIKKIYPEKEKPGMAAYVILYIQSCILSHFIAKKTIRSIYKTQHLHYLLYSHLAEL